MPSLLSHPAVPLALRLAGGKAGVPPRLLGAAVVASMLPDADAVGYFLGVPYDSLLGHRGLTHSLFFALAVAGVAALFSKRLGASASTSFWVVFASCASHGLLDALTSGGLGVAFWSPFSNERYFFPWRPIAVSPLGVSRFLGERGLRVLLSEIVWIWIPCLVAGLAVRWGRARRSSS
jgi:inner membrane protein